MLIAAGNRPEEACCLMDYETKRAQVRQNMDEAFAYENALVTPDGDASLIQALHARLTPDVTVSSPEQVGYVHRVDGADHLYFLANISDDARRERVLFRDRTEACRVFATVARAGEKEMREIPFLREQTEAGAALTIPMAAHESCFVVFSP